MCKIRVFFGTCLIGSFIWASPTQAQTPPKPTTCDQRALIAEPVISGIGPTGPIKKLHTDFEFTEGPVAIGDDVYFTDIPKERVYKVDANGNLSVAREQSNFSNGLFHHRGKNEIVACEMKTGRVVAISLDGKNVRPVAEQYDGNRFNAPNDLVVNRQGGIYFTDPHFRAPMPLPQGKTCVYYVDPEGKVTRLVDDLKAPNGVILSPDEKTLYVIPSLSADMMAYPVESPGKLGPGRVFCTLEQAEGQQNGGGDGLTVDIKGNLYITSRLGIQVFDPQGKLLGIIRSPELIPEQPSNCTFGGKDNKTLYITARKSLYACPMEVPGHQFPAGKN